MLRDSEGARAFRALGEREPYGRRSCIRALLFSFPRARAISNSDEVGAGGAAGYEAVCIFVDVHQSAITCSEGRRVDFEECKFAVDRFSQ